MYTQQGTCGSSVLLLLIVYLLHFPCGQCPPRPQLLVGAVGTTGKLGTLLGLEGGPGSQPPPLLSPLETRLLQPASSCRIRPTCVSALCSTFSPAYAFKQH